MGPHLQVPHQGRAPGEEKARGAIGSLQGGFASGRPDTSRIFVSPGSGFILHLFRLLSPLHGFV